MSEGGLKLFYILIDLLINISLIILSDIIQIEDSNRSVPLNSQNMKG
jgi:hypothetical protein